MSSGGGGGGGGYRSGGSSSSSSSPTKPSYHKVSRNTHLRPPPASPSNPFQQMQQQQQEQQQHHRPRSPAGLPLQHSAPPPPSPRLRPLPPPLLLTIRFSTSLPDLLLDIPRPTSTTVVALKHLIRSRLEEPTSQRRLRFIHAGRILPDAAVLSDVLRVPPPLLHASSPAAGGSGAGAGAGTGSGSDRRSAANGAGGSGSGRGKGKGKAVEGAAPTPQRVYVNCSIGDSLTDAELAEEARAAAAEVVAPSAKSGAVAVGGLAPSSSSSSSNGDGGGRHTPPTVATRTPRGFDRLLAAGFLPAEVNQLRLQFRSIQAARHTPDTMPSPDTLRSMEDAWMDNQGGGGTAAGGGTGFGAGGGGGGGQDADGGAGGAGADGGDDAGLNGVLDVLLRGMLIGFLWPLGSVGWLIRQEGLYSRRWKVFVSFGFMLSLSIGMIRALSGDPK